MKTFVFDFFGVICRDPHESWFANHADFMGEHRTFFDVFDAQACLGEIEEADFIKAMSDKSGIPADEIEQEIESYFVVNPEMIELVKSLKEKHNLIVLSNAPKGIVEHVLESNGLRDLFDALVISADIGMIKPSPEIYRHVLEGNGLTASDVVYVDDNPKNVEAAQAMGIKSVIFTNIDSLKSILAA
jgi:putative hydrolase of the HAD superfamily